MKLAILLTILPFLSNATTYYVSNAGSDAANGTSTATSWQTISKVNAASFASGDSILFKCGDTWAERLKPPASDLYFGSYSSGVKPLITGFQTATFGAPSANIYTATTADAIRRLNTVSFGGNLGIKARYPNSTYLIYTSGTTTSLATSLTGTPSYTGKETVVRVAHWVIDVTKTTAQTVGALTLSPALTYTPNLGGNGFFFQNDVSFLDSANEWTYDSTTTTLKVYATSTPAVQYSILDTLVWVVKKNNITFNGISFTGANTAAFQLDSCSYITIKNSTINNCGAFGIRAYKTHHSLIDSDTVMNCLSNGIYMRRLDPYTPMQDTCNNTTVTNNVIRKIGFYAGMGLSNNERYNGIEINGDTLNISRNRIDSIGYLGLRFNGRGSLIKNNYVTGYCGVKDDCGGIYTVIGAYIIASYNDGSIIRGNIVGDPFTAASKNGVDTTGIHANSSMAGIYLDDESRYMTVDSNISFNTKAKNMNFRTVTYTTVNNNIMVNDTGTCINMTGTTDLVNGNNTLNRNIFYQKGFQYTYLNENKIAIIAGDSNFYIRMLYAATTNIRWGNRELSFSQYKDSTGLDAHGGSSVPRIFSTTTVGVLYYNPTFSDSTITLPYTMTDVYGNIYPAYDNLILHSFRGILLFRNLYDYTKSANLLFPL